MLTILDGILAPAPLAELARRAGEAVFEDGRRTAGRRARAVKNNLQARGEGAAAARRLAADALLAHAGFRAATLVKRLHPPLISRYLPGMAYGLHTDDALMAGEPRLRSDLAVTLFLSPPEAYEGGELYVEGPWGAQAIKLPAGSAVVYPAGTLHQVLPVTRGERLAAVSWIESHVRDPAQRELLLELDRVRGFLVREAPEAAETGLAHKCYGNLLRLWAET